MLYSRCQHLDMVKVFGPGPVMDLKDLDVASGLLILDVGGG